MPVLTTVTLIEAPAETVFEYASDLSNELEWGTPIRIVRLSEGPIRVGSRFSAEWKGSGPVDVEYIEVDAPRRWATVGRSRKMDANLTGEVEAIGARSTRFTAKMEILPHGWLKVLTPVLVVMMSAVERRNGAALKAAIEKRNT